VEAFSEDWTAGPGGRFGLGRWRRSLRLRLDFPQLVACKMTNAPSLIFFILLTRIRITGHSQGKIGSHRAKKAVSAEHRHAKKAIYTELR
jgi:hypothetical protein